jgi:3-oxoacyl-[acyl-carrier protein] reductase
MSETIPTALVTGGSRGIGRAVSQTLARDGYQVYLTYVSRPEEAQATCDSIRRTGGKARALCLDVGDPQAIVDLFANEIKEKVDLRALINNAGLTRDGLLVRMQDEKFMQVIDVNLRGAFICMREAAKIMIGARRGYIVNITSISGERGNFGQINYAAAKAGLTAMTRTAALELAARNITVNAVSPGFITTDMTDAVKAEVRDRAIAGVPLGRAGTPQEVAEAVAFFVSGKADYITGQELDVNGGMYFS